MANQAKPPVIMFSAGEASGDKHAANMFLEMRALNPEINAFGMGAAAMRTAGIDVVYDSTSIAVIGVIEVIKHYPEIRRALQLMHNLLQTRKPDLLVCVDYKDFNFKLASYAKRLGIKVLFYVSPQVWAWRPGRVKQYAKVITAMAVIFPFETCYYEAENVPVRYVGHPSVDKVKPMYSKQHAMQRYGLDPNKPVLGLLPGSRANEIKRLLPVMLAAAELIIKQHPDVQLVLPQAHSISDELLSHYLDPNLTLKIVKNEMYDVVQCCDAVMTSSGTATLEVALLGIPMLIAYRLSPITYGLGRLLVKTPFIGLPNIVASKAIIREFIQHEANAPALAQEAIKLLSDTVYADNMRKELSGVKQRLGQGGASHNMAQWALELLA